MHPSDAERAGDSLALPGEEGLLVVLGEEEAEPGVLPGLQDAVEEVARQPGAPQRDRAGQEQALGGLEQPQAVRAAAGCMRGPRAGDEGTCPLHTQHACFLKWASVTFAPWLATHMHVSQNLHQRIVHEP